MLYALLVSCSTLLAAPPADPPLPGTWTATFEDDFNGTVLDGAKWKVGQHWAGINGGAQPHQDNMAVQDGALVFTWDRKDEPFTFGSKTAVRATGEVSTFKRFHQQYGYFACRMKYEVQRGCWPAFWTMPAADRPSFTEDESRSYIKFDLTGRTGPVTKALLKLKLTQPWTDSTDVDVYPVTDDSWQADAITWNNRPPHNGIFADQYRVGPDTGWTAIDVTGFVNEKLAGNKTVSLMLADMYQRQRAIAFAALESGSGPVLNLDGTDIPAAEDGYVRARYPDSSLSDEPILRVYEKWNMYNTSTYTPGMEIDIHECLGIWGPYKTQHAVHWNGYGADHQHAGYPVEPTADQNEYRTFGLYWAPDTLEFYVDGTLTGRHTGPEVCAVPSFMILSGQVGGWSNNGTDLAVNFDPYLPKHLYVDYVKAWSGHKDGSVGMQTPRTGPPDFHQDSGQLFTVDGRPVPGNAGTVPRGVYLVRGRTGLRKLYRHGF